MYVYCLNLFENSDRSANFSIRTTTNYSVLYYVMQLLLIYRHVSTELWVPELA